MNAKAHVPYVHFRLVDGSTIKLTPPSILGRMTTAELCLANPQISEAHALLSLRGDELRLISLRGKISVNGHIVDEVSLVPGLSLSLAEGVELSVQHVELPLSLIGVCLDGGVPQTLINSVYSVLQEGEDLVMRPNYVRQAVAYVWREDDEVVLQERGREPCSVPVPSVQTIAGRSFHLFHVPLAGVNQTKGASTSAKSPPLQVTIRYDTVHIEAQGSPPTVLGGIPARILSELYLMGNGPVHWKVVAEQIWPREQDVLLLTDKWQKAIQRLRSKLISAGVREDLFYRDRSGTVEIIARAGDIFLNLTGETS